MEEQKEEREKMKVGDFLGFKEVAGYFFRKKDPNRPKNFNLKMMHGINKISIIMFLIALTVMIVRYFSR